MLGHLSLKPHLQLAAQAMSDGIGLIALSISQITKLDTLIIIGRTNVQ